MQILVLYILLCMLAGIVGRNTRLGFWGVTVLSFFITPPISIVFSLLFSPPSKFESGR